MSAQRFSFILIVFLLLSSQSLVNTTFAETSADEAASTLANAEETLVSSYQAVLKAEESGANASSLLTRLNEAGEFLARARMEYQAGNFEEATVLGNSSRNIGVEVENEAIKLRNLTLSEDLQRMVFTIIASVLGVAFIALGSFWLWRFLKKRYGDNELMKAK